MADHDHTYKLLFSHAELVTDLIRGFVHEDWVRQQEGFEEGLEKGREEGQEEVLERLRRALLREMEGRFGALPESVRGKVAYIGSIEEIASLIARTATASSLSMLGL